MKSIVFFICVVVLFGCNSKEDVFTNDINFLKEEVASLSKIYGCDLSFKYTDSDNLRELELKFNIPEKRILLTGKILLEIDAALVSKGICTDSYLVKVNSNILYKLSKNDISIVRKQKVIFENSISILTSGTYDKFYDLFCLELKKSFNKEELFSNFDKLLKKDYPDFSGFNLSSYEGNDFVIFMSRSGSAYTLMSFKLFDESGEVFGFELG